jgi:hypothetical protein
VIHGARYDSYLYIRYINGAINADRATWLSIVFRWGVASILCMICL